MDNELNLFDLFLLAWRGCKRAMKALWRTCVCAIRLTIRKWWISLPVLVLFIAGALIYTRQDNLTYKVYAVAKLNGPTLNLFNEVFRPLQSGVFFNGTPEVAHYIYDRTARRFETFPVIDCLRDNIIDEILKLNEAFIKFTFADGEPFGVKLKCYGTERYNAKGC